MKRYQKRFKKFVRLMIDIYLSEKNPITLGNDLFQYCNNAIT